MKKLIKMRNPIRRLRIMIRALIAYLPLLRCDLGRIVQERPIVARLVRHGVAVADREAVVVVVMDRDEGGDGGKSQ